MLLPVLDGWRFLEVVLKMDLDPKPSIIVTTGSPVIGRDWVLAHGCKGLLHKPIDPEALLEGIRAASAD
jgi:CheY-like chemotaxis protein